MTDRPYTDNDIRAEAADQHRNLRPDLAELDLLDVSGEMTGSVIQSTLHDANGTPHQNCKTWDQLGGDDYDNANNQIMALLENAADVSEWAVNLGADDLEPSTDHELTIHADDRPIARIHFAFEPGMPEEMRTALVEGIGHAIAAVIPR